MGKGKKKRLEAQRIIRAATMRSPALPKPMDDEEITRALLCKDDEPLWCAVNEILQRRLTGKMAEVTDGRMKKKELMRAAGGLETLVELQAEMIKRRNEAKGLREQKAI